MGGKRENNERGEKERKIRQQSCKEARNSKRRKGARRSGYRLKYSRLRRAAKALVFENAALCDEVARLERKFLRARDERRFLLGRLLRLRALAGADDPPGLPAEAPGRRPRRAARHEPPARPGAEGADGTRPLGGAGPGRPALPLALGPLTVHSLGEVPPGPRQGTASSASAIFPVGFRSTRLFASARRPARRCLYTCRIADGGAAGPRFEIVAEDEPGRVLAGPSPDACHARLAEALGAARGRRGAGADFFGLTHPAVRSLLRAARAGEEEEEDDDEEDELEEEDEDEEEEDEDEEDEDEEDEDEDEEDEAAPAFAAGCSYGDVFLGRPTAAGSPAGSDE
ncbi:transforming growth factor beta regulator 1 [Rhea pennata]|uniref:transforming growth factor beta regulator 1 n=1 Tax=Rhea pennata TaxID=8795 RepID=UPI002E2697F7